MTESTYVVVTTQVEGLHHWRDDDIAPPEGYEYLKHPHRHMFHIKLRMKVGGSRLVEILDLKKRLTTYCKTLFKHNDLSCEEYASNIAGMFANESNGWIMVGAYEDDENGGEKVLEFTPPYQLVVTKAVYFN